LVRIAGAIPANIAPRNLVLVGGTENSKVRQMLKTLADIHCEYYPAVSPKTASQILSTCAFAWLDYFTAGSMIPDLLLKSSSFANVCAHAVVCVTPRVSSAISLNGDSLPGPFAIAHDEEAGIIGHLAPFVEIKRNRIRALKSRQPRREHRRENPERPEGAVDVKPDSLVAAQRAQRRQIVDGADVHRSGRTDDKERRQPAAAIQCDLGPPAPVLGEGFEFGAA
jgi:hypothetical protein